MVVRDFALVGVLVLVAGCTTSGPTPDSATRSTEFQALVPVGSVLPWDGTADHVVAAFLEESSDGELWQVFALYANGDFLAGRGSTDAGPNATDCQPNQAFLAKSLRDLEASQAPTCATGFLGVSSVTVSRTSRFAVEEIVQNLQSHGPLRAPDPPEDGCGSRSEAFGASGRVEGWLEDERVVWDCPDGFLWKGTLNLLKMQLILLADWADGSEVMDSHLDYCTDEPSYEPDDPCADVDWGDEE